MGKPLEDMSRPASQVSVRISRAQSPASLRVPGAFGRSSGRPKSAEMLRRDTSFSRTYTENSVRRSGSFSTNSRLNKSYAHSGSSKTNKNFLQVPEITIQRPSTDGADSDSASCSSRDQSPSPYGRIEREILPPGSPVFRRAMVEMLSESEKSDFSGEETSDDNDVKVKMSAKSTGKGQCKITPQRSSAYKVVRHGKRVSFVRNHKR